MGLLTFACGHTSLLPDDCTLSFCYIRCLPCTVKKNEEKAKQRNRTPLMKEV